MQEYMYIDSTLEISFEYGIILTFPLTSIRMSDNFSQEKHANRCTVRSIHFVF